MTDEINCCIVPLFQKTIWERLSFNLSFITQLLQHFTPVQPIAAKQTLTIEPYSFKTVMLPDCYHYKQI